MVNEYDKGMLAKFNKWLPNVKIVQDKNALFATLGDEENDKIKFPVVALIRMDEPKLNNIGKTQMTGGAYLTGVTLKDPNDPNSPASKIHMIQAIPIALTYTLAIFDTKKKNVDDLWQQLMFAVVNNPMFEVEIPYSIDENGKPRTHKASIAPIVDSQDTLVDDDHLLKGTLYGYDIDLEIQHAYLFRGVDKDMASVIGIDAIDMNIDDSESIEEVYTER